MLQWGKCTGSNKVDHLTSEQLQLLLLAFATGDLLPVFFGTFETQNLKRKMKFHGVKNIEKKISLY